MKKLFIIMVVCLGTLGVTAGTITNMPAGIELPDQFEKLQKLSFPNTNVTVLTIADRKGSEQIAGWVAPVAKRFGTRVDVRGIADVSAVPRLLRGTVRSAFRREQTHPVMMDWSGNVVAKFAPPADATTVLLIDGQGRIVRRFEGAAKTSEVQELCKQIEQLLPPDANKVVAHP